MSGPTCPKCGFGFASPMDITVHERVLPNGIWDGLSMCEWGQRLKANEEEQS